MNFGNKEEFSSKGQARVFSLAVFAILALMSANVFAATTVRGSHFNPGAIYYVYAYTSSGQACLGAAGTGHLNTTTINSDDPDKSAHNGWTMTFDAADGGTTIYFSLCEGSPGSLVATYSKSMNNNTEYVIDAARVNSGVDLHTDFTGTKHWNVCTSIGGTKLNDQVSHFGANPQAVTNAFFFKDNAVVTGNYYVFAKTTDDATCNLETSVTTGRLINLSASADNYGVDTVFSPDTKTTSNIDADFNDGYMWIQGTSINPGFSAALTGAAYTLYYDNPAAGQAITVYLFKSAGSFPTLASYDEKITGYDTTTFASINMAYIKISGNVPDEVASVTTTIGDYTYTVLTSGASGSKIYELYVPASTPTILFKDVGGNTIFTYNSAAVAADKVVNLGKIYGSTHSGLEGKTIQFFENNVCTGNTTIQSIQVTPASNAYTAYIITRDGGTTKSNFYPKLTDGVFETCGAGTGDIGADRTINANYTRLIIGTVSTGISTSGGVVLDLNDNSVFNAGTDPSTKNFSTGAYRLYVSNQTNAHSVLFFSNSSLNVLELNTSKRVGADITLNVAQVNWTVGNIHRALNNSTGSAPAIFRVYDEASSLISSEVRNYSVSDSQFYEVPATGTVSLHVYTGAGIFYARNYTPVAGESLTFEPYYNVTLVAPASASYWDITKAGAAIAYYRANGTSDIIYVDKTLGGAGYTYDLYNTTLVLSRGNKNPTTNDVWNVNTVTFTAVHADITGAVDPITVYTVADYVAACTGSELSSTTTVALANGVLKYYERAAGNVTIKIVNATTTCYNTRSDAAAAGGNNNVAINVKTSGSLPDDIDSIRISTAEDASDDITSTALSGTPYTYAIYSAADAASDISYYDVPTLQLDRLGKALGSTINVGKVLGSSHDDINAVDVYSDSNCTTQVSSEPENPGPVYVQYFEHAGSVYVAVGDGTYTTCKRDALTVGGTNQEALENFDRKVNGTVPDVNGSLMSSHLLSVKAVIPGTTNGYTSATSNVTDAYAMYVNSTMAATANSTITYHDAHHDALLGAGNTTLSLSKLLSADATFGVSAAYGATHDDIEGGDNRVAICYGTMPTSNADCSTKASTAIVIPSAATSTYEIFFEQVTGETGYNVSVKESVDTVNYYSWNGFESSAAGTISNVVLSGKYSGAVRQAYSTTKTIGNVLVKMYTHDGDPDTNRTATTYTYEAGTLEAPTGNYRMYGTTGQTYDSSFSKSSYITQAGVDTGALDNTDNIDLVSGIAINVTTQEMGTNVSDATVSILNCTSAAICNADTALGIVCTVAGVANKSCVIVGNSSAGTGKDGMYYFAGLPEGTKFKIKVAKTGYTTYTYPSAYDSPATNFYNTSSTVAISKTVQLTQIVPSCTLTAVGGSGTYSASGQLYSNATGVITFTMDCGVTGLNVTGDLSALGGIATQAFSESSGVYSYQLTSSATSGTKTVTVTASTGANSNARTMSIIVDTAAPTISASSPSAAQNTRSVTISATTDTAATCRYSTTDQAYTAMTNVMAGSDTLHEAMVLATNNATNHYYVRCIDLVGNSMSSSTDISFPVDAIAPSIVNATPAYSATPYRAANIGSIQVATDVAATCKWGAADANYSTMTSAETTVAAGTLTTLTGLSAASGLNMIYVRCRTTGVSTVEMSSSGLISFNYDATAPTYEILSVTSSGGMSSGDTVYAKSDDVITVKFAASEVIVGWPNVSIGGQAMGAPIYNGSVFTYTRTLTGTENTAAIIVIGNGTDAAGNTATTYSDGGANVEVDFTAPAVSGGAPTSTQNSKSFMVSVEGGETGLTCRYSVYTGTFDLMEGAMADLGNNTYRANALVAAEGSTTVYFACRDLAGNINTTNTSAFTVDATAPTVIWVTPQGGYNNTDITLAAYTQGAANCAWDVQDGSGYPAMNYAFSTTGGTSHSTTVTTGFFQQGINHIYVSCQDLNGVNMTSTVVAYFNYDTIAPSVYDWGYSINRTGRTLKVWIIAGEALNSSSLAMTFDGNAMSYFFGNGSAYTFNYTYGSGLSGTYLVTVSACTDLSGNACVLEPVYFPISITIDEAEPVATATYNATTWMLSVTTDESATCMYGYSDVAYDSMPFALFGSGTAHTVMVHPYESSSAYNIYVRCSDTYGNDMASSETVDIHSDTVAPSIVGSYPSGIYTSLTAPTLSINTSENASCQYSTTAFAWGSGTAMSGSALTHTASLGALVDGTYSYYVLCRDTPGNNTMASGFPVTFVVDTTGNFNYTYSLNLGWNSVWLPRIILQNLSSFNDSNYSTVNVLNTRGNLTGFYNYVYYRNGTSCSSQNGSCWLSYDPTSVVNDLTVFNDWDNLPYWLNMNATGKRLAFQ